MYALVDVTFTNVMSINTTVYSRRNTTLTVGTKWFNMKLCNLYYIILTIWTPEYVHEQTLYPINICQCTRLTILCNENPTFPLFVMI